DIDAVHHNTRAADELARLGERAGIGLGRERLRADVKGNAERLRHLPRLREQAHGRRSGDAELVLERDHGIERWYGDAHPEREVSSTVSLLDDLLQLVLAVEREGAAAELESAPDGMTRLHGMHEVE